MRHINLLTFAALLALCVVWGTGATEVSADTDRRQAVVRSRIHVRLVFAGVLPLFMRSEQWSSSSVAFGKQIERSASDQPDGSDVAEEPVLLYDYSVSVSVASAEEIGALGKILDSAVTATRKGGRQPIDGTTVANEFRDALKVRALPDKPGHVGILLFSPRSVAGAPEFNYGYVSGLHGKVDVVGFASSRFAFIDLAARPFVLANSPEPTLGELLLTVSRDQESYGTELGRIIRRLVTPPLSANMRRPPNESGVSFSVLKFDANAVVGAARSGLPAAGASFDANRFGELVGGILKHSSIRKKVSVDVSTISRTASSLALSRAFREDSRRSSLDSDVLWRDIISERRSGSGGGEDDMNLHFHADASFVVHVPVYLFSFADSHRGVSFGGGKQTFAKVVGNQAVLIIENRLFQGPVPEERDITSLAVKHALELMCGIPPEILTLVDTTRKSLTPLVEDMARRNILHYQLMESRKLAVVPASAALDFNGYDKAIIPHAPGTPVGDGLALTGKLLSTTLSAWERAVDSLSGLEVYDASTRLMTAAKLLDQRLSDEICNRPLRDELELEVEVTEGSRRTADRRRQSRIFFLGVWLRHIAIPGVLGVFTALLMPFVSSVVLGPQNARILRQELDPTRSNSATQWFSTLGFPSNKPKVN